MRKINGCVKHKMNKQLKYEHKGQYIAKLHHVNGRRVGLQVGAFGAPLLFKCSIAIYVPAINGTIAIFYRKSWET